MEKARIIFENEDSSKKIVVGVTDLGEGNGMKIDVDFGEEGNTAHKKGLYVNLANYLLSQFK